MVKLVNEKAPEDESVRDCQSARGPVLALAWALRVMGGIDLLSLLAVIMPRDWIAWWHAWTGLGELPVSPIVFYLARSASALYSLHGVLIIFLSTDVRRYWLVIRLLAWVALVHGVLIFIIDWQAGLPLWWKLLEGPTFFMTGVIVLLLQVWILKRDPQFVSKMYADQ
ncbi:Hypothetical protein PBC10988_18660 [Planctomycetales bacterium 10988]|nr:Hypothetical protein PBC10988_18660 [Planctomycetales bacterium 10988]